MEDLIGIILLVLGLGMGIGFTYFVTKDRVETAREKAMTESRSQIEALNENIRYKEGTITDLRQQLEGLHKERTELIEERSSLRQQLMTEREKLKEQVELLAKAEERFTETFRSLSYQALDMNNRSFLALAEENLKKFQEKANMDLESRQRSIETVLQPISSTLTSLDTVIKKVEEDHLKSTVQIQEGIRQLSENELRLQAETAKLVNALRTPGVRGRWGEMHLRRLVEMAGMTEHCDFDEQMSADAEEGKRRPDMVINLPGDRTIIVDSKVPLTAYLEALESSDEETRRSCLERHARQIRTHIDDLSSKKYWDLMDNDPEFVVMFIPGEMFFSAALEIDPQLIEYGVSSKVILASPTTLIALLLAIAHGWREHHIAENAQKISSIGKELYDRIDKFRESYAKVGKHLASAVDAYNSSVPTFQSRLLVSARKLKELNVTVEEEIDDVCEVEKTPRYHQLEEGR
ncbi:MAG: DNA recombination protein RmuC [Methanomassiliicoccales archaeon]|nr:MAG: DNA recombination protein RmuC [Methanomassiliicoccales archaeon]